MALLIFDEPSDFFDDIFSTWARKPLLNKLLNTGSHRHLRKHEPFGDKIVKDKHSFMVCMDVQQFSPDDITVKTIGQDVIVEAKHEDREDGHGLVYRHFVRRYKLPEGYRPDDVTSSLSSDGVLTLSAPKAKLPGPEGERIVPITATGPVHKNVKKLTSKETEKLKENQIIEI